MVKAVRAQKSGGPEVMVYEDIDLAPPGPGQVQIKHTAIGVNFIDTYMRSGLYPTPTPFAPGNEAAGTIAAVGAGVTDFKIGDRVTYVIPGGG